MNQAKLAEYLGTSAFLLGGMLRMQRIPNFTSKRGKKIKRKIEELTEMTVSELFPNHVFTKEFLGQDKTIQVTRDVPFHLLTNAGMVHQLTLPPDEELIHKEGGERYSFKNLDEALSTLTKRERRVLHERFYRTKSLERVGSDLRISGGRVRQIEAKALRKLRHPMRIRLIRGDVKLEDPLFQTWLNELKKKPMARFEK
jgi:RNA polymerase sigma factor (sigma-70 family)